MVSLLIKMLRRPPFHFLMYCLHFILMLVLFPLCSVVDGLQFIMMLRVAVACVLPFRFLRHGLPLITMLRPRGAVGSNPDSPPPPPLPLDPPKVFEYVFLQIDIVWKSSGTTGTKEYFPGTWYAVKLFVPPLCVYSKCSTHIRHFKSIASYA